MYELERLVTVAIYVLSWEAQLAKARLASEGVAAVIADENAAGIYGANAIGGIKLRVREDDAERATALLGTCHPLPALYLVTDEDAQRVRCPSCRSEDVVAEGWFRPGWSCSACGHKWRGERDREAADDPPAADPGLVTVARFRSPWEAHLARTLLESQGIESCVLEERLPPLNLLTGDALPPNRLEVHAADAERAAELLAADAGDAADAAEGIPAAE